MKEAGPGSTHHHEFIRGLLGLGLAFLTNFFFFLFSFFFSPKISKMFN